MAQVITIAQQKGGAGKTTIAAHIAVSLAQTGRRIAIIDIDPQGSLSRWHALREKNSESVIPAFILLPDRDGELKE